MDKTDKVSEKSDYTYTHLFKNKNITGAGGVDTVEGRAPGESVSLITQQIDRYSFLFSKYCSKCFRTFAVSFFKISGKPIYAESVNEVVPSIVRQLGCIIIIS